MQNSHVETGFTASENLSSKVLIASDALKAAETQASLPIQTDGKHPAYIVLKDPIIALNRLESLIKSASGTASKQEIDDLETRMHILGFKLFSRYLEVMFEHLESPHDDFSGDGLLLYLAENAFNEAKNRKMLSVEAIHHFEERLNRLKNTGQVNPIRERIIRIVLPKAA